MARLRAALPKGTRNGLGALDRVMVSEPKVGRWVVALVDCSEVVTNTDTGDVSAVVRIRHIEHVNADDQATAEELMTRSYEERTGERPLPFDEDDPDDDG